MGARASSLGLYSLPFPSLLPLLLPYSSPPPFLPKLHFPSPSPSPLRLSPSLSFFFFSLLPLILFFSPPPSHSSFFHSSCFLPKLPVPSSPSSLLLLPKLPFPSYLTVIPSSPPTLLFYLLSYLYSHYLLFPLTSLPHTSYLNTH